MKYYQLNKKDYIVNRLHIIRLAVDNTAEFESYETDIHSLIDCFNKEYIWNNMFDMNEVKNRIKNGHILFILYYDSIPIGYVWFKKINDNVCFGYNLYVTKKINRPKNSAKWFYNEAGKANIMGRKYKNAGEKAYKAGKKLAMGSTAAKVAGYVGGLGLAGTGLYNLAKNNRDKNRSLGGQAAMLKSKIKDRLNKR
jgi:hypothetical protein